MFISFEGIEGVGKSTQLAFVEKLLVEAGVSVIVTREPGGTRMGEEIRDILLSHRDEHVVPMTELLLMFAARSQHVGTVIRPALERNAWVLCDRFVDATYAYQGGGRGLSVSLIERLENLVLQGFKPDRTLVFDAPPEIGLERVKKRGAQDRIEQEKIDFFRRVRTVYQERAATDPKRYHMIDATQSIESVQEQVSMLIQGWIHET